MDMNTMEQNLEYYSQLFDSYLAGHDWPPQAERDTLAGYLKEVLDDPGNKHLCSTDVLWKDILKNSLMEFFSQMIPHMDRIAGQEATEKKHMQDFLNGDIQKKRQMWPALEQFIRKHYSPAEVNLEGYIRLMRENSIDKDAIFQALVKDWQEACQEQADRERILLVQNYKNRFRQQILQVGQHDYQTIRKTTDIVVRYPQLQDIIQCMGRERQKTLQDEEQSITRYIPILLQHSKSNEEINGVRLGNDLGALLPTEVAWLSDSRTESLFYQKFATSQLQLFSSKPPFFQRRKTDKNSQKNPRLQEGPMIICIDTSGSMSGKAESIAKALTMQILQTAKRKNRKCYLITFSIRAKVLEISQTKHWKDVRSFMRQTFTGGTDGEMMFTAALQALQTETFSMADVLVISDFQFTIPCPQTNRQIQQEQQKDTRFYGLQIGSYHSGYEKILDRMWFI